MQRFKKNKEVKLKKKNCVRCGNEYLGHCVSKYCDICKTLKREAKQSKVRETNNIEIKHSHASIVEKVLTCKLEGCEKKYTIEIFPNQFIYPAFCPEHRNPYKRRLFKNEV